MCLVSTFVFIGEPQFTADSHSQVGGREGEEGRREGRGRRGGGREGAGGEEGGKGQEGRREGRGRRGGGREGAGGEEGGKGQEGRREGRGRRVGGREGAGGEEGGKGQEGRREKNKEQTIHTQSFNSFTFTFTISLTFQQLRKLVLELIHRLPANEQLKGHVKVWYGCGVGVVWEMWVWCGEDMEWCEAGIMM